MLAELALTGLVAFFPQQLNCDVWTGRLSFSFTSVMVSVAEVISWLERLILFLPSCHQFSLSSLWQNCNFHFHSEVCFNLLPHAIHLNPLFPKQEIIKNSCEFWPQRVFFFFFQLHLCHTFPPKGQNDNRSKWGVAEEKNTSQWRRRLGTGEVKSCWELKFIKFIICLPWEVFTRATRGACVGFWGSFEARKLTKDYSSCQNKHSETDMLFCPHHRHL